MDKLAKYRQLVKSILSEYTQYKPTCNDLEIQAIFDEQKEHYQVVTFGGKAKNMYIIVSFILTSSLIKFGFNGI